MIVIELAEDGGFLIHGDPDGLRELAGHLLEVAVRPGMIVMGEAGEEAVTIYQDDGLT